MEDVALVMVIDSYARKFSMDSCGVLITTGLWLSLAQMAGVCFAHAVVD
jgi:hypothetical protein